MAAVLASPQQVNLFNPALLPAREKFSARQLLGWIVFAVVALAAVAWWAAGQMRELRTEIAQEQSRPRGRPQEGPTQDQVNAMQQTYRQLQAQLATRQAALDAARRGMAGPDGGPAGVMRRLAETIPPTVWL